MCLLCVSKRGPGAIGPRLEKVPPQLPPRSSTLLSRPRIPSMATIRAALPQLSSAVRRNAARQFHSSPFRAAVPHPITAHGPPPKAPAPSAEFKSKARQSENEPSSGEELPSKLTKPSPLKSRFWKDVHVHGKAGMFGVSLTEAKDSWELTDLSEQENTKYCSISVP